MPDRRNADLAKIHIARKQLGMDEDTYRAVLWTVARVRSAKDLDDAGRHAVLDHLRARGFKARRRRDPGNVRHGDLIAKIEAQLASMGLEWAYVDGIARRMFKVDSVRFCKHDQLRKLVAALAYEQEKRGLLASIDELLGKLGRDRTCIQARAGWERHLPTLRLVCGHLADEVGDAD